MKLCCILEDVPNLSTIYFRVTFDHVQCLSGFIITKMFTKIELLVLFVPLFVEIFLILEIQHIH